MKYCCFPAGIGDVVGDQGGAVVESGGGWWMEVEEDWPENS